MSSLKKRKAEKQQQQKHEPQQQKQQQEQQPGEQPDAGNNEPERVTMVRQGNPTKPTSMKLSVTDIQQLEQWLGDLSVQRNKRITSAKLFRALIHMRESINNKKLIEALKEIG